MDLKLDQLLLNAAGEGIYGLDKNGITTFVNPAAVKMLGYSSAELIRQPMHSLLHHTKPDGSFFPKETCPIYASFSDGQVHHIDDEVFWRKDGSSFPVEYTSTPIRENRQLIGAVVVFKDITERLQAQQRIENLMRQNQLLLSAAGEGICGVDCSGKTTFVNPAALSMLGYLEHELINTPMHDITHHTNADGTPFFKEKCPIYAAFQDGQVHLGIDDLFWRKNGTPFPVEYSSTPIYENNQLTGAVIVFKDITERKKNEKALQLAYENVERMRVQLEAENDYLQEEIRVEQNFAGIVGNSHAIQHLLHQIDLVAPTEASVLISGESGTGKELIAHAIHDRGNRKERPLIRVNCAAIPRELFESEFFGHVKGAFTGALKNRTGRFELANGGTIFLDEVGEIPIELQSKLLRVLQEGQFERVGEDKTRKIDVRIIAATNRDLKQDIIGKTFREDLYFRLNVFPLEAIPLRGRIDDIPILAKHFISLVCRQMKRNEPQLTQANVKQLQNYAWPGNVRELQNIIERVVIVSRNNRLNFDLLNNQANNDPKLQQVDVENETPYTEKERLAKDKANIKLALKLSDGKISGQFGAAELLKIRPTTLQSRMKALGIKK